MQLKIEAERNYPYLRTIVTSCRGSWKWQDAYRISTYRPVTCKDGLCRYKSIYRSQKYSEPQLRKLGLGSLPKGSLHNELCHIALLRLL